MARQRNVTSVRLGVLAAAVLTVAALIAGCSSDSVGDSDVSSPTSVAEESTTTVSLLVITVGETLSLAPAQCYGELPPPPSTTTITTPTTAPPQTEKTAPDTLPMTTIAPQIEVVAVVDCRGPYDGEVFATFCLGEDADARGDERLAATVCPGLSTLEYPGDQLIRRTAARVCIQRFEEISGEPYGQSDRTIGEFIPTEGLWEQGERRVVCYASPPPEPDPESDDETAAPPFEAPPTVVERWVIG